MRMTSATEHARDDHEYVLAEITAGGKQYIRSKVFNSAEQAAEHRSRFPGENRNFVVLKRQVRITKWEHVH